MNLALITYEVTKKEASARGLYVIQKKIGNTKSEERYLAKLVRSVSQVLFSSELSLMAVLIT